MRSPIEKQMNMSYEQPGFDKGYFMWPLDYDPIWLSTCDQHRNRVESDPEPAPVNPEADPIPVEEAPTPIDNNMTSESDGSDSATLAG